MVTGYASLRSARKLKKVTSTSTRIQYTRSTQIRVYRVASSDVIFSTTSCQENGCVSLTKKMKKIPDCINLIDVHIPTSFTPYFACESLIPHIDPMLKTIIVPHVMTER